MEPAGSDIGAIEETVAFLDYFKELPDPRQAGKVIYPLAEVLLLCLLAVLAGAESFVDIARFGEKKIEFLRRFRPFHHGTPAHDHLGDIFAVLDAERFQRCFVDWVAALTGAPKEVVAIDGKTLRRSGEKKSAKAAIHMVSAFAARQRLVLGQVKVADKANEIVAIPKLLDLLAIEGAIVTLDAIGCQRAIAQQILDKKADYVLALKGNQGTLREDVELFAAEQKANGFKDAKISRHQTVDGDHGRIETRTYTAIHDVAWLQERHGWPGLQGVIMVESTREIADKIERETRFYITSLVWLASQLGPVIRSHWAIENSLHWVMDMIFRDDECRIRTDHAPANFTTIKHMAQNLIRKAPGKDSLRLRRKTAAWDDDFLASLLAHDSFTRFPWDERRLESSDNAAGFTNERLALPARPLGVLFGKRRHRDHLAMPALAAQPAEKATLQKLRVEPIGLRPAVFARHRDTRCMNDVDLDAECSEPARQPEAVVSGLERDGDAGDLVTFLLGFLPPAAQQLQQCVLIDRDLLQRLALNTRNNASDEPTRLTHLDHRDQRRVHIQLVQTPAEIVHSLGFAFHHRGAPSGHGQSSDG